LSPIPLGCHRQGLAVVRDAVRAFAQHFPVGLGAGSERLAIGAAAERHRAGRRTGDRTAVQVEERTSSVVGDDRGGTFGYRLAVLIPYATSSLIIFRNRRCGH
jgi:hypothetical protein